MHIYIYQKTLSLVIEQRERTMLLHGLYFHDQLLTTEWTDIVDFVEIFQAFNKNHLQFSKQYPFTEYLTLSLCKEEDSVYLQMSSTYDDFLILKLEAAQIVHKTNRILARCTLP